MLARLHLDHRYAAWRETVHPPYVAGVRGRLTALRDFCMTDSAGETVLLGVSEWLYVIPGRPMDRASAAGLAALTPEGMPRAPIPEPPTKLPDITEPEWSAVVTVRRSDRDFTTTSTTRIVEWALECLPDAWREQRRVREMDIAFRGSAHRGDTVITVPRTTR